jgi:hypothetical protein
MGEGLPDPAPGPSQPAKPTGGLSSGGRNCAAGSSPWRRATVLPTRLPRGLAAPEPTPEPPLLAVHDIPEDDLRKLSYQLSQLLVLLAQ